MAQKIERLHHSHDTTWLCFERTVSKRVHVQMKMSEEELQQEASEFKVTKLKLPQALHDLVWLVHTRYWDPADLLRMSLKSCFRLSAQHV